LAAWLPWILALDFVDSAQSSFVLHVAVDVYVDVNVSEYVCTFAASHKYIICGWPYLTRHVDRELLKMSTGASSSSAVLASKIIISNKQIKLEFYISR